MTIAAPEFNDLRDKRGVCPLRAGSAIESLEFEAIRRRMMLQACKWDAQVEDICTLSPFPLLIDRSGWKVLATLAESLAGELMAAEDELAGKPELHHLLSIPRRLRNVLRGVRRIGAAQAATRVLRFDFHWTRDGWRISEVNSDVPGGYAEASEFPGMIARHFPNCEPAGNPAEQWAQATALTSAPGSHVALLSSPGFMEDHQVVAYLAQVLQNKGIHPHLAQLQQLIWQRGRAFLQTAAGAIPLSAIVRFYQAEWLAFQRSSSWSPMVAGGLTPVCNPGTAALTESKRFPLTWDALTTPMPTWRRLLPETRDPRDVGWRTDDSWLLKAAWCNTGDAVIAREWVLPGHWRKTCLDVLFRPAQWVAQRRFDAVPVATPVGELFPCVGVYTINGRTAGAYARLSRGPVVDYKAIDAALLVKDDAR